MNWVYASSNKRPSEGEMVLCDLGADFDFMVAKYIEGCFFDVHIGCYYILGQVKRWCSIGKHFDEQF